MKPHTPFLPLLILCAALVLRAALRFNSVAAESAVKIAHAGSIMPAHHALNGVPCHANSWLLDTLLRKEWGAILCGWKLRQSVKLESVTLEMLSQEVVIGLLAASVMNPND